MDIQEYHSLFANKTYEEIVQKYLELGMDVDKIGHDHTFYCLWNHKLPSNVFLKSLNNSDIHPGVTPEMVAKFICAWDIYLPGDVIRKYARYDRIKEVVNLLLSSKRYFVNDLMHIEAESPFLDDGDYVKLDSDKLIFVIDIIAENGYYQSMRNNISIDYFGPELGPTFDRYVDEYKRLCLESIKTCDS